MCLINDPRKLPGWGRKGKEKVKTLLMWILEYTSISSLTPFFTKEAPRRRIKYSVALKIFPIGMVRYPIKVSPPTTEAPAKPSKSPYIFSRKVEKSEAVQVKSAISKPSRMTKKTIVAKRETSKILRSSFR